ncbi:sulfotransferase [Marinimicrococcus flavescens]|uniref:Sulfotransferase n=1 Tax=Marinimicrococcus flavescens TaxID=3031815 RepID=A0AAP3V162_9PROT|nr:sulfotransferase [Marinimicrococcus flavescens]
MRGLPPRIVYIAGYGHSGSTLLNIILGQHPDAMGAGELFRLAGPAWRSGELCSCGEPLQSCPVWREIVRRWEGEAGSGAMAAYRELQAICESRRPWQPRRADRDAYGRLSLGLFAAIREVTGKPVIVDSSKLPARAAALARVPGLDLRVLHLVRDGRGVAWSLRRRMAKDLQAGLQAAKRQRSALRTGLMWMLANLATERTARGLAPGRAMRLRYETLVAEPVESLTRVGELAGLDMRGLAASLAAGGSLAPGHVMAGNRLRMAGTLSLRADSEWQRLLPAGQRRLIEGLCLPVMRRYGYPPLAGAS